MSQNRFCDFLADPDSRSFSRFGAIIMPFMPYTLSVRPLVPALTGRETRLLMLVDAVILGLASRLAGWLAG
eukprot:COSAG06_NODE_24798_length_652_cov_1.010850_1_plen_71_part_00